jgi:Fanconi anemia group J protein
MFYEILHRKTIALLTSTLAWQKKVYDYEISTKESLNADDDDDVQDNCINSGSDKGNKTVENIENDIDSDFETPTSKTLVSCKRKRYVKVELDGRNVNGNVSKSIKKKEVTYRKIYFCTRTHSQIAQVVQELKQCHPTYVDNIEMCILGSRSQLCINAKANKKSDIHRNSSTVNDLCQSLLRQNGCSFANSWGIERVIASTCRGSTWDIEDLVSAGKKSKGCPYYVSRATLDRARIIFAPYNYILDARCRNMLDIDVKDAVIVFDEGHNIADACRSAASVDVSLIWLRTLKTQLDITNNREVGHASAYKSLYGLVMSIYNWMEDLITRLTPDDYHQGNNVWSGVELLDLLVLSPEIIMMYKLHFESITSEEKEASRRIIHSEITATESKYNFGENNFASEVESSSRLNEASLILLGSVLGVFEYMVCDSCRNIGAYKVVLEYDKLLKDHTLHIWCLNAEVTFGELAHKARSIILTSGTLSPMDSYAQELGTVFDISLEAGHVINVESQIFSRAVSCCAKTPLLCTYQNYDNALFHEAVGRVVLNVSKVTPGGTLVFFPSYSLLNTSYSNWTENGFLDELRSLGVPCKLFIEPRNTKDLEVDLKQFYQEIDDGKKAIFLSVCRGKVSEGINFSDDYARSVIIVGIPYPSTQDCFIKLMRQYQDEKREVNKSNLDGETWYTQQAFRAINQSIGRCIRHKNDYGAIIFCDTRFASKTVNSSLSKWIRSSVINVQHFEDILVSLSSFFEGKKISQDVSMKLTRTATDAHNSLWKPKASTKVQDRRGIENSAIGKMFGQYLKKDQTEVLNTNTSFGDNVIYLPDETVLVFREIFLSSHDKPTQTEIPAQLNHLKNKMQSSSEVAITSSAILVKSHSPNAFLILEQRCRDVTVSEVWVSQDEVVYRYAEFRYMSDKESNSNDSETIITLAAEIIACSQATMKFLGCCWINACFSHELKVLNASKSK